MELTEKTLSSKTIFNGKIVTLRVDQAQLPGGACGVREVVEHPGGVCVLALKEDGAVPVVRQFRYPLGAPLLELPAGKLERGEQPTPAAVRELEEEVGLIPGKLTELGFAYTSPGFSDEKIYLYLAQELKKVPAHPDEDEFLEVSELPFEELIRRVMSGEITDAKTVMATLKVKTLLGR